MKEFFKYMLATIAGIVVMTIIGFVLMMMVVGALMSTAEKQVLVHDHSMLVLKLDNQIVDRAPKDPFSDLNIPGLEQAKKMGLDDILSAIAKARDDDRIKCIYLDLSVINAGMATVEEIRNALKAFADSSDKPVYAYSNMYDQKAYYLATAADKVVLHPQGGIDFRGLGGEVTFYKKALEKLGVNPQIIRHGKFKAAVEPFMLEKMSNENREQVMVYLNNIWAHMLKAISEKRGIPIDSLNRLADKVMTFRKGEQALAAGLVDTIYFKDQLLDDLRKITGSTSTKGIPPCVTVADYTKVPVKKTVKKGTYSRNKIAVIYASGEIGSMEGSDGINGEKLAREIRKVRQDSSYKAIVLRIDSPGGSAFDSEVIWREGKLAAGEKTVVASFGDLAASGGYYIACAADKIVAQPNTITGSIGIFGIIPDASELLNDKLGITTDVVKTNQHSDIPSFTRPMNSFEINLLQEYIEEGYSLFVSHVADGRKMDWTEVDAIGQGRVWTGENALKIGLVDQLGGLEDAVKLAAEMAGIEHYRIVKLPELPDPLTELLKGQTVDIRTWFLKRELGENWKYFEQVQKLQRMKGLYARLPYDPKIY